MTSQLSHKTTSSNFLDGFSFPLSGLRTEPSFMSSTGSGATTISFYKGPTRNLEIGNTPFSGWGELGIYNDSLPE